MPDRPTLTRVARFGFVNAYLVVEDDGLTLVDTGLAQSERPIVAAAANLGMPIVRIALTHAHGDHIGSLDRLAARLPGAEVLISARDARLLAKDRTPEPGEPDDAKFRGSYVGANTEPTGTIAAGDRIGSLEAIPAPGHTPGQMAFLDTRDRTLIAGDAYSTMFGVATAARARAAFPLVAMATWHHPTALASARALRALEPRRLATGHGPVIADPLAAMDAAIARGTRA